MKETLLESVFQTEEFRLSEEGIHLLRSGFNYQTIKFDDIKHAKISKGMELHNWFIIYLMGAVFLIGGFFLSFQVVDVFLYGDEEGRRSGRLMVVLLLPLIGAWFVYTSLRRGMLITIVDRNNKRLKLPLKTLINAKQLNGFASFLRSRLDSNRFIG